MNLQGAMVGARWEKVGQGWRRVRPYIWRGLLRGLVGLVVAGAILALIYVPKMQVPVCPPDQSGLPPKICFDIENEARRTLAYIIGGLLAIIGIYMAHRRIRALERQVQIGQEQLQVAQEGQITERFTRAIEQLGSDKMEIRLGGIYALERIANDSDKDYWPIMETLTAFVGENAPWREPPLEAAEEKAAGTDAAGEETKTQAASATPALVAPKPTTDIQAVLTVLGRRKYHYGQGENQSLDLHGTDLEAADLSGAHLEGAILTEAHLDGAYLWGAHLEGAGLIGAHLKEASLMSAHFERANLSSAHLEGADLMLAHLDNADLKEAHMNKSDLFDAHLKEADLRGAHLDEALLWKAHLEGADFSGATGLTREQLAEAIIDDQTRLPDYLQEEIQKAKETGGG